MKRILVVLGLLAQMACASGYHVELAPTGVKPFQQSVDILLKNDCSPRLDYYTHGVHRDSIIASLPYGGHTTVRLKRPLFAGQGSYELTLMADAYRSADGTGYLGSASQSWSVDSWNSGKNVEWKVNAVQSPESRRCPRA